MHAKWSNVPDSVSPLLARDANPQSGNLGASMAGSFRDKIRHAAETYAGIDPRGGPAIPRTGTDRSSKRQFLALFLLTITIMVVGITIALSIDESDSVTPTPTVVVTATATAVG
jgi:hypothetical protein